MRPLGTHFDTHRLHQPVDPGIETADPVREPLREHGDGALGEVNGGAPLEGFPVEWALFGDVVSDVGDMNSQEKVAVVEDLNLHRIVEVTGRLAIDSDDVFVSEIGPARDRSLGHLDWNALCFLEDVLRKRVRKLVLGDNDAHIDTGLIHLPQNLGDSS